MKKTAFLFMAAAIVSLKGAQAQTIHAYGIKVGYASAGQRFDHGGSISTSERRNGINAAVFAEWSHLPFLSYVAQVEYTQRGAGIYYLLDAVNSYAADDYLRFTRLDYISVPVFVKMSIPARVVSPYIVFGPRCDFLLGYTDQHKPQSSEYYQFKKVSLGASAGCGFELNSILSVGMLLEIRYNFDMVDTYTSIHKTGRNNSIDAWFGVVF